MIQFLSAQGQPPSWVGWLPFIGIFAIFYFLIIRPQQKRQKDHRTLLEGLKKGDHVITSGGIHGSIVGLKDDVVVLRVDENCKIEVTRQNIAAVIN